MLKMSNREGSPVKLIYAAMFALFPLSAPAQIFDSSLLSALCNDDYYEDTAGHCSAGEVLSIADILQKYSAVTRDAGTERDELVQAFPSYPEDMRSITPKTGPGPAERAILTLPDNDFGDVRDTISSQVTMPQPQIAIVAEAADDIAITGPAVKRIRTDDDAGNE